MKNKVVNSNELKTDVDNVCTHCGAEHYGLYVKEGVDFVFETDGENEWCICVGCKKECDDLGI